MNLQKVDPITRSKRRHERRLARQKYNQQRLKKEIASHRHSYGIGMITGMAIFMIIGILLYSFAYIGHKNGTGNPQHNRPLPLLEDGSH